MFPYVEVCFKLFFLKMKIKNNNVLERVANVALCDAKMISISKKIIQLTRDLRVAFSEELDARNGLVDGTTVGFEDAIGNLENISEGLDRSISYLFRCYYDRDSSLFK